LGRHSKVERNSKLHVFQKEGALASGTAHLPKRGHTFFWHYAPTKERAHLLLALLTFPEKPETLPDFAKFPLKLEKCCLQPQVSE